MPPTPLFFYRHFNTTSYVTCSNGENMKFTTHNDDNTININGTSRQGYINANYPGLCKVFGPPIGGDGFKIDWEWELLFDDGTVATIYNWKNGPNYTGQGSPYTIKTWNVGGHSGDAHRKVKMTYQEYFETTR